MAADPLRDHALLDKKTLKLVRERLAPPEFPRGHGGEVLDALDVLLRDLVRDVFDPGDTPWPVPDASRGLDAPLSLVRWLLPEFARAMRNPQLSPALRTRSALGLAACLVERQVHRGDLEAERDAEEYRKQCRADGLPESVIEDLWPHPMAALSEARGAAWLTPGAAPVVDSVLHGTAVDSYGRHLREFLLACRGAIDAIEQGARAIGGAPRKGDSATEKAIDYISKHGRGKRDKVIAAELREKKIVPNAEPNMVRTWISRWRLRPDWIQLYGPAPSSSPDVDNHHTRG